MSIPVPSVPFNRDTAQAEGALYVLGGKTMVGFLPTEVVAGPGAESPVTMVSKEAVATIVKGQPIAIHSSGTGMVLASAGVSGKECVGFANETVLPTFSGQVKLSGALSAADWAASAGGVTLAARAVYYLSATAGQITTTPPSTPGQYVQVVGREVAPDTLGIEVTSPILL